MSKRLLFCLLVIIVAISCKQKRPQSSYISCERFPGWSVMADTTEDNADSVEMSIAPGDTIPDEIPVTRVWKDLSLSLYLGETPSPKEIAQWKRDFESANPNDSVCFVELARFKDMNHYVAVQDYIELLHGPRCESYSDNDRRLLWRLDQYDPLVEQKPRSGFKKVQFIRWQYERLLDYELGSQWDMNSWSWLSTDFRSLYGRTLEKEILRLASQNVSNELKQEFKCEEAHSWASSNAFQMIYGSPVWSGSSFSYRVGCFGIPNIDMGNNAKEVLLQALYDPSFTKETCNSAITRKLLEQEYATFANALEEDEEYTFSLKEQKDALNGDKSAFFKWMEARAAVSSKLSGTAKIVYDNATQTIMRRKIILLKNRFNIDDGFCLDYVVKNLLSDDCSDEEIMNHSLERLLENE